MIVKHNKKIIGTFPLSYAGTKSTFKGALKVSEKGVYELTVYAYDPVTGNTGVDKITHVVK